MQLERHATRQVWSAQVESARATLAVPLLYWPGWTATIDGQATPIEAAPDLGYIQIEVPRGAHQIAFELGRTPLRSIAELVSLAALVGVVACGVWVRRMNSTADNESRLKPTALWVGALIVAVRLAAVVLDRNTLEAGSPMSMDFVNQPWLHHNPNGIDFGGVQLMRYDVGVSDQVKVGLSWKLGPTETPTVTFSLMAPSAHFLGGPSPIVEQTQTITTTQTVYDLLLPYALPTGMYYLRVKTTAHEEYLSPLWIASQSGEAPAVFGQLTPTIGIASVHTRLLTANRLDVRLTWTVSSTIDANYAIALRLHDTAGKVWTSLDTQPGYGFQPTSAWQPGTLDDAYTLDLPADLPRDQTYALDVIVYRVASQQELGRTTIDAVRVDQIGDWRSVEPPARTFTPPPLAHTLAVTFNDQIRLLGYDLTRSDRSLTLNLAWRAQRNIDQNYKVFVHVFDPATEKIVAQSDVMPRNNTYPTSRWISGEVITDTVTLTLPDTPPGVYRVAIGLFDENGRLPISGSGAQVASQRVVLEDVIEVR